MTTTKKKTFKLGPKYLALCARVEKLDPVAAKYMREEAPKLASFGDGDFKRVRDPERVLQAFLWVRTPQGFVFWDALDNKTRQDIFPPQAKPKAAKKPKPLATWEKIPLNTNTTKSGLVDIANELGAKNAKLKNQITKLKESK